MSNDITLFYHSCDVCQHTVSKGHVSKVPLGKMPIIDMLFKRVAIDIIGEIFPASSRRHRYILTLVDFVRRYAEAVPLKTVTTTFVAEALVGIFMHVGIPKEILSDRGMQLTSAQIKKLDAYFF